MISVLPFVLVTGVTVALTVPAVAIVPQKTLQQMLPANTALYATVDLNPAGSTRSNLIQIGRSYLNEQAWPDVWSPLQSITNVKSQPGCVTDTVSKAADNLSELGHDTAFALIPAPPRVRPAVRHEALAAQFARNFVIVAPLEVRITLLDVIAGLSFSIPKKAYHYRGVSIYRQMAPECSVVRRYVPDGVYYLAVDKGYALIGLEPRTIKAVIDSAAQRRPSLASTPRFAKLFRQLPGPGIGSFFVNTSVLDRPTGLLTRLAAAHAMPSRALEILRSAGTVAGTVTAGSNRLQLTVARPHANGPITPSAGQLARHLPSATRLFVSSRGMKPELVSILGWMRRLGLNLPGAHVTGSILKDVNGEADVVQPWNRPAAAGGRPRAFLYFQTQRPHATLQWRAAGLMRRLGVTGKPHTGVRANGLHAWYASKAGYVAGWGTVLLSSSRIARMPSLTATPARPLSGAPGFPRPASTASPYQAEFYVNVPPERPRVQGILERLRIPLGGFRSSIPLFVGPVQWISGTVSQDRPDRVEVTSVSAGIAPAPSGPGGY